MKTLGVPDRQETPWKCLNLTLRQPDSRRDRKKNRPEWRFCCLMGDGPRLAVGLNGSPATIRIWNLADDAEPVNYTAHATDEPQSIMDLAFSSDGSQFISVGCDGLINISDSATGASLAEITPAQYTSYNIIALSLSADGQTLAVARSRWHSPLRHGLVESDLSGDRRRRDTLRPRWKIPRSVAQLTDSPDPAVAQGLTALPPCCRVARLPTRMAPFEFSSLGESRRRSLVLGLLASCGEAAVV